MSNSQNYIIEPEIIVKIKQDLYHLIRRYCRSYKITDFEHELFLHDSTKIEYIVMPIAEVERFISIVNDYWSYFPRLISNLSFEEDVTLVEHNDRIIGMVDTSKTNILRMNQQRQDVVVCRINNKNIVTPENILLASVLIGIHLLATKLMKAGKENQIPEFKNEHEAYLQKIIDYAEFLLKDRLLKKLVDFYLLNYENNQQLIIAISQRINQYKIRNEYFGLIRFVKEWKNLNWILNEQKLSFRDALTPYLDSLDDARLYEIWIFYKIVSLFEPVHQKDDYTFVSFFKSCIIIY